ncbi:MAG: TauD/TfdA dioxygenase family protein, partial [Myxococcota bacterium]
MAFRGCARKESRGVPRLDRSVRRGRDRVSVRVEPVTATVGATITGVDLREPLGAAIRDAIERALLEHGVVFFRGQDITPDQQ